jgi:protein gp37
MPQPRRSLFTGKYDGATGTCDSVVCGAEFPYPNVHVGVSVEDQKNADERIPLLLDTPAAVRFVSYEPALEVVDFSPWLADSPVDTTQQRHARDGRTLSMIIVGGESGSNRRPMPIEAVLKTVDDCRAAGVPVFVKQDSALRPGQQGRIPDSHWVHEWPK